MAAEAGAIEAGACQRVFHQRWQSLHDPHVRALAWLLDSPDLLDSDSPRWEGKIATLGPRAALDVAQWLQDLDNAPSALHDYLSVHPFTRLGRYAERLLGWYFLHRHQLHAQGLQVRSAKDETIGEFDFLLMQGEQQGLLHWEFATKLYLLCSDNPIYAQVQQADYFVGPNLADTLGAKMRKILQRQLALGNHPAAQALLGTSIETAQALIKGWLFYRREESIDTQAVGLSAQHCRGWWCTLAELETHVGAHCVVMPRLAWLAPARIAAHQSLSKTELRDWLERQFSADAMPVMVASLQRVGDEMFELERGFVVPDDWRERADQKMRGLSAPPG